VTLTTGVLSLFSVAFALGVGAYFASVLDGVVRARVAQRKLGPGSAVLAPLSRAALLAVRSRTSTERPDARARALAPALLGALAATAVVVVPVAPAVAVADVPAGIVLFGAAIAMVMVAVFLHGWSANSLFPLIGGYRFVAAALSFEMPLALVLIAAALPAESLQVGEIVRSQAAMWNVVRQPLGLPLYLMATCGAAFWGPLALPDASDLAGGSTVEVGGPALLVWSGARYALLVALCAMGAAVFLGGWLGPGAPGPAWLALKTAGLVMIVTLVGHYLPRVRLEDFVAVSWTVFIPLALVDVFLSGLLLL
jgi:NADH-quinone oxidoreductase subunit H